MDIHGTSASSGITPYNPRTGPAAAAEAEPPAIPDDPAAVVEFSGRASVEGSRDSNSSRCSHSGSAAPSRQRAIQSYESAAALV